MAKKGSPSYPEAKGLAAIVAALLLLLSLLSFSMGSPSHNWLGLIGYGCGWLFTVFFGLSAYLVAIHVGWLGWNLLARKKEPHTGAKNLYFLLLLISCSLLLNLFAESSPAAATLFRSQVYSESIFLDLPYPHSQERYNLGGLPLYYLYRDLPLFNLQRLLGNVGLLITFSITGIAAFLLWTEIPCLSLFLAIKNKCLILINKLRAQAHEPLTPEQIEQTLLRHLPQPIYPPQQKTEGKIPLLRRSIEENREGKSLVAESPPFSRPASASHLPPPSLLRDPKKIDHPSIHKELRRQAEILEETLTSFGIEAKVGDIHCGPTIASFEVHPAVGVKVQKITALENDIALNLQAKSIRIIAPIPGKAAVGVEVPSIYPQEVSFKEMLLSYQKSGRKLHIPILLGKTVSGENVFSDLAKMPHCIIAGATGSGKSVCINTIIVSILMNASADEIRLLMIDPKKVELTPYAELPHMIAPVITEPHGAYAALSWLVKEMQNRYDILKQLAVRNIAAFNQLKIERAFEASLNIPIPEKMPTIVAIIDEFADLMMVSSTDLETPIARIAQMARAVGIHLILATQRPSREVITGLIKANFPTRIAFKVASRINSQIILDETGAENLLGNGDMLFLPPGSSHLVRAQGAYISDEEIQRVIAHLCKQSPPQYLIPSFDAMRTEENGSEGTAEGRDTLYNQARELVLQTQTASTTFLQRKLKIGYARAASLMDELETKGIIGPQEGSRPRRVFSSTRSKLHSVEEEL